MTQSSESMLTPQTEKVTETMELDSCTIGKNDGSSCHLKTYTRTAGLKPFTEFTVEEQQLLCLRSGVKELKEKDACVCIHHDFLLLTKYEYLQNFIKQYQLRP